MFRALAAAAAVGLAAGSAAAAGPIVSKPIDTSKYLVQPTDQATGIVTGATRTLSRVVAGTIEENGFVKTINTLLGRKKDPAPTQLNGLPAPSLYPSTSYPNSFQPVMPTAQTYRR
ncbi:MAG: hypothetical protein ACRC7O_18870 [Fimbriiglobus sp.]